MSRKTLIYIGLFLGSTVGAYIPTLWGSDMLSLSSVALSGVGGILGIWLAFRVGE